jgi:hypothetical protein
VPLSEEEQRLLDEMERNLYGDHTDVHSPSSTAGRIAPRGIAFGLLGIALGIVGLVVGVATGFFVWGLLGFALILAGCFAALSMRERLGSVPRGASSRAGTRSAGQTRSARSFMQRLEDRWDQQGH